jgi:hypothetical protein
MGITTHISICALAIGMASAFVQGQFVPPVPGSPTASSSELDVFDRSREWSENVLEVVATERGRLVVVFVVRPASPEVGLMRLEAWSDPGVISFAHEHARVVEVSLERPGPLGDRWRVERVPTTIVFRDGIEIDRAAGYLGTARLLGFLRGAQAGRTTRVRLEESLAGVLDGTWKATGNERLALAHDLLEASRLEDAAAQYEWLWDHLVELDSTMERVRRRSLVLDLKELCGRREASGEVFAAKRDVIEAKLRAEATWELLADWLALNGALGDEDRSLAWFDRVKVHPDASATLERFAGQLEPLLEGRGEARAAEVILLYSHPEWILSREFDEYQQVEQEMRARLAVGAAEDAVAPGMAWDSKAAKGVFVRRMAGYYCALLRQGRLEQARIFAEEAKGVAIGGELVHAFADAAMAQEIGRDGLSDLLESAKRLGQETGESEARLRAMMKK